MNEQVTALVANALKQAEIGVDYNAKYGAICPFCQEEKLPVSTTKKWQGNARVRYHYCPNPKCLFFRADKSIKSIQQA